MISLPLLLIGAPIALAVVIYVFRRLTLVATLASAASTLGFAWLINNGPATADEVILGGWVRGGEQLILGRPLYLSASDRPTLITLGLAATVLLILAARLRPADIFFPALPAILGLAAAVLVIETFAFTVLMVEVLVAAAAILLQGSRFGTTRGAWRFFLTMTLAVPLLMVAAWQIDFQAANPRQTELLKPAVMLLTFGFAIYLTSVPFHLWMAPSAGEGAPLVQSVLFGFLPIVLLSVIATALENYPWFAGSEAPFQWFAFAGALTTGLGALLAFGSKSFGQLAAYSLLIDAGALLQLLGLNSQAGLGASIALLWLRIASLALWSVGLTFVRSRTRSDQFAQAAGIGGRFSLYAVALLLGGLSLAGFPLTVGFPGRWLTLELLAAESSGRAALLLMGSISATVGTLRMAGILFVPDREVDAQFQADRGVWLNRVMVALVLLGATFLAVYPEPVLSAAAQLAGLFTFFR